MPVRKEKLLDGILDRYSCYLSIVNIKSNLSGRNNIFQFYKAEPSEILKIMTTRAGGFLVINYHDAGRKDFKK